MSGYTFANKIMKKKQKMSKMKKFVTNVMDLFGESPTKKRQVAKRLATKASAKNEAKNRDDLASIYKSESSTALNDFIAKENVNSNVILDGAAQKTTRYAQTDSMYNIATSLGVDGYAKTPSSCFKAPRILSWRELESLYAGNGTVRRIIDTIANEMTREWVKLDGDDKNETLTNYLMKLDTQKNFADLVRWGNLMGGALIIMLINDGRDLIEPVDVDNIKTIEALRVVDLGQVFLYPQDYYSDPASTKFNEPEWYTIRPIFYGVPSEHLMFKVHETRVLQIDGAPCTQFLKRLNKGWMAPIIQSYIWDIINLEQSYSYAAESVHEMIVSVFSLENLSQIMARDGGESAIKARMDIINYAKSMINSVVIDAGKEKFEKIQTNVSQIEGLLDKFERKVCAMCGIPHAILFGDQRGGIVNAESGDVRGWYDSVRQKQMQSLFPLLKKLLDYISFAQDCNFKGDVRLVTPNFNALWQYEEKDLVDMELKTSQKDAAYIDRGVYTPEEVRQRFLGERFNFDLHLGEEPKVDYDAAVKAELVAENEDIDISNDMNIGTESQQ